MSTQELVKALGALTPRQRKFVLAFTDAGGPGWQNQTQAATLAGYSEKSAPQQGSDLRKKPKIRAAIAARLARVQAMLDLDHGEYAARVLEQADAWKDEDGEPLVKRRRYFHEGEELACDDERLVPGMAQYRALELLGKLTGHVRDEPGLPVSTVFVIAMPTVAKTAEEWFERFGKDLQQRDHSLPPGREVGRS